MLPCLASRYALVPMTAIPAPPPGAITRFAPSPTGGLHLGHAHAALFAATLAAHSGGRFLLRLEDIDTTRCRPEFAAGIGTDLAWLGLVWEHPARVQSAHFAEYRAALARLDGQGLLFPCFCTRGAIAREIAASGGAPQGPDGPLYPGTCRRLSAADRAARLAAGAPHALRLDMAAALAQISRPLSYHELGRGRLACDPARFGDVVLARREVPASYHLCVTHDDAVQGVTLVTRGVDLQAATALHRLLQELLGWPEPAYAHHPLILGPDGKRLAKRDQAPTLAGLRAAGIGPDEVRTMAGFPGPVASFAPV